MAQLKAGSTVGGVAIAVDSPASVPTASLAISGDKVFGSYVIVKDGSLMYNTTGSDLSRGYVSGGQNAPTYVYTIDSFPFTSPFTTATNIGNLSQNRMGGSGQSSSTTGYTSGGVTPIATVTDRLDSFPFLAVPVVATNIATLSIAKGRGAGQQSSTSGFTSGGAIGLPTVAAQSAIESFPFSAPFSTTTSAGDLFQARYQSCGQSSSSAGYTSGGNIPPAAAEILVTTIDSFPFSAPFVTASSTGALSQARNGVAGQSSSSTGYTSGGAYTLSPSTIGTALIDSFPFSAPFSTATSAGSLSQARYNISGQSGSTAGFSSGGSATITTIDKFPFSTPFTTATSVGSLSQGREKTASQQF